MYFSALLALSHITSTTTAPTDLGVCMCERVYACVRERGCVKLIESRSLCLCMCLCLRPCLCTLTQVIVCCLVLAFLLFLFFFFFSKRAPPTPIMTSSTTLTWAALLTTLVLACTTASVHAWENHFDGNLDYHCSSGGFYRVKSYHDNDNEDRRWDFSCTTYGSSGSGSTSYTSNYQNNFDDGECASCVCVCVCVCVRE